MTLRQGFGNKYFIGKMLDAPKRERKKEKGRQPFKGVSLGSYGCLWTLILRPMGNSGEQLKTCTQIYPPDYQPLVVDSSRESWHPDNPGLPCPDRWIWKTPSCKERQLMAVGDWPWAGQRVSAGLPQPSSSAGISVSSGLERKGEKFPTLRNPLSMKTQCWHWSQNLQAF